MPWSQTPMEERMRFVVDYERGLHTVTELCHIYEISRKTAYKWLDRFHGLGAEGLQDQSRAPHRCPHRVAEEVAERLLGVRRAHPAWGARKLLGHLVNKGLGGDLPSRSTVENLLRRRGMVAGRRRRRRQPPLPRPTREANAPNELWAIDFKGEFYTRDARYCYPLTLTDSYSRYLLGCVALPSTKHVGAREVLERLFREYGLPEWIRSDGGPPFASPAIGRLSRLSVWWIKLGIRHEVTQPSRPDQNGRHERMHRDLKREATRPPQANLRQQQREFDRFRQEFNEERPHEALGQRTPAMLYTASVRPYPKKVEGPEYPGHFQVRRVSKNGGIRWNHDWVNVSTVLAEEYVGLEEVEDEVWDVYFGPVLIGRFQENERLIYGAMPPPATRHESYVPPSPIANPSRKE